ncbi:hypothetical protein OURE66S_00201 [Oligella ureolytica]
MWFWQLIPARIVGLRAGEVVFDGPAKDVNTDVLNKIYGDEDLDFCYSDCE